MFETTIRCVFVKISIGQSKDINTFSFIEYLSNKYIKFKKSDQLEENFFIEVLKMKLNLYRDPLKNKSSKSNFNSTIMEQTNLLRNSNKNQSEKFFSVDADITNKINSQNKLKELINPKNNLSFNFSNLMDKKNFKSKTRINDEKSNSFILADNENKTHQLLKHQKSNILTGNLINENKIKINEKLNTKIESPIKLKKLYFSEDEEKVFYKENFGAIKLKKKENKTKINLLKKFQKHETKFGNRNQIESNSSNKNSSSVDSKKKSKEKT